MSHIAETSVRGHDVRPALAKAQPQLGHKPLLLIIALAALPSLYWMLTEAPVISVDRFGVRADGRKSRSGEGLDWQL